MTPFQAYTFGMLLLIHCFQIDKEVIKACRVHLRSVCGDSMDKLEGPNHKVKANHIGTCMYLHMSTMLWALPQDETGHNIELHLET